MPCSLSVIDAKNASLTSPPEGERKTLQSLGLNRAKSISPEGGEENVHLSLWERSPCEASAQQGG